METCCTISSLLLPISILEVSPFAGYTRWCGSLFLFVLECIPTCLGITSVPMRNKFWGTQYIPYRLLDFSKTGRNKLPRHWDALVWIYITIDTGL